MWPIVRADCLFPSGPERMIEQCLLHKLNATVNVERIVVARQSAGDLRQRRAARSDAKLAVRETLRQRQAPALVVRRVEREQAVFVEPGELSIADVVEDMDFVARQRIILHLVDQAIAQPAGAADDQKLRNVATMTLQEPSPNLVEQQVVLASLDGANR